MIGENVKRFKSLRDTYKINMFLLTIGLMNPNPKYDKTRKKVIICAILSVIPLLIMVGSDMHLRILRNDMPNLVRQVIVSVATIFVVVKLIITLLRKQEFKALFDNIDRDYQLFNDLSQECQSIVEETILKTKKVEKMWCIVMGATAASYPVLAGVWTMYSQIFSDNPKRFMIHETAVLFLTEEQKYETPYYELISIYVLYTVIFIFIGFVGFDGMFYVCMLHISLKLQINKQKLKNVLYDIDDIQLIKRNIASFVNGICEVERLMDDVQKCFEIWLIGIFFNSILQIGMPLSQVTNKTNGDINQMYYFFIVATVVHIYLPCYFASDITSHIAEIANVAYSCSWERVQDVGIRKSICIIIAKAQTPISLRALGMITFNMEMFVSILRTAYSMYTLLRK